MSYSIPNTIEIPLTKDYVTIVDECDAHLAQLKWLAVVDRRGKVYACHDVAIPNTRKANRYYIHRMILEQMLGVALEKKHEVDHIDGDSLNNRRANLRLASRLQNAKNRNMPRNNTSGVQGVLWSKNKGMWIARIGVDSRYIHLGYFFEFELAVEARKEAETKYYGEFAHRDKS